MNSLFCTAPKITETSLTHPPNYEPNFLVLYHNIDTALSGTVLFSFTEILTLRLYTQRIERTGSMASKFLTPSPLTLELIANPTPARIRYFNKHWCTFRVSRFAHAPASPISSSRGDLPRRHSIASKNSWCSIWSSSLATISNTSAANTQTSPYPPSPNPKTTPTHCAMRFLPIS